MASITGKDGYVLKQVPGGALTLVAGIKEWSVDYSVDMIDTTSFAVAGVTHKSTMPVLMASTGSFSGNHTDEDTGCDLGTSYYVILSAHSGRAYYGSAYITNKSPSVTVDGEATMTYSFQFTGKVYVLGANVVVDGGFTAGTSAAWDVGRANISYDTADDQINWDGDDYLEPASNDVIVDGVSYWTQMLLENETGTTECILSLGTTKGTDRTADGTYTEIITANDTTFKVDVTTDGTLSLSEIKIRPILN